MIATIAKKSRIERITTAINKPSLPPEEAGQESEDEDGNTEGTRDADDDDEEEEEDEPGLLHVGLHSSS